MPSKDIVDLLSEEHAVLRGLASAVSVRIDNAVKTSRDERADCVSRAKRSGHQTRDRRGTDRISGNIGESPGISCRRL